MWENLKRFFKAREPEPLARWKISVDGYGRHFVNRNTPGIALYLPAPPSVGFASLYHAEKWIENFEKEENLRKRKVVKYI